MQMLNGKFKKEDNEDGDYITFGNLRELLIAPNSPIFKPFFTHLKTKKRGGHSIPPSISTFPFCYRDRSLDQNVDLIGTALLIFKLNLMSPKDIKNSINAFELLHRDSKKKLQKHQF
jgi:hypothetical protein